MEFEPKSPDEAPSATLGSLSNQIDELDLSDPDDITSERPSIIRFNAGVKSLLLHHDELEPLYMVAISLVKPEVLEKALNQFILQYAQALQNEAVNTAQARAAIFLGFSAASIATEITSEVISNPSTGRDESSEGNHRLDCQPKSLRRDNSDEEDLPSADKDSLDCRDSLSHRIPEYINNFMFSADAFTAFCDAFKAWLNFHKRSNVDVLYH